MDKLIPIRERSRVTYASVGSCWPNGIVRHSQVDAILINKRGKIRQVWETEGEWYRRTHIIIETAYKHNLHTIYTLPCCTGFSPHSSIKTAVKPHVGKNYVLEVDIENFFDNVSPNMGKLPEAIDIMGAYLEEVPEHRFWQVGIYDSTYRHEPRHKVILSIANSTDPVLLTCFHIQGTTTDPVFHGLPQGYPASPLLANIAMYNYDASIMQYAKAHGLAYTRYADNLILSGSDRGVIEDTVSWLKQTLRPFNIPDHKIKIMPYTDRQKVLGLVINKQVSIPRKKRRILRAMAHQLRMKGSENLKSLDGHIAYMHSINTDQAKKLAEQRDKAPAPEDPFATF